VPIRFADDKLNRSKYLLTKQFFDDAQLNLGLEKFLNLIS